MKGKTRMSDNRLKVRDRTLNEYQEALNDALIKIRNGAGDYKDGAHRLVALLTALVRQGHSVKIQTKKGSLTLDQGTENIGLSGGGYFRVGRSRISTQGIQMVCVLDATVMVPALAWEFSFTESDEEHAERLGAHFMNQPRKARLTLLRKLNRASRGLSTDAAHVRATDVSWEMASMTIDELMEYLDVRLDGSHLVPLGRGSGKARGLEKWVGDAVADMSDRGWFG
jgi:hypothetical protein